jgi:dienelactone hydrolase
VLISWPRGARRSRAGDTGGRQRGAITEVTDRPITSAGVKHDVTVYPGAPHSFFDRKQAEFAEASADAWRRVQAFVRQR